MGFTSWVLTLTFVSLLLFVIIGFYNYLKGKIKNIDDFYIYGGKLKRRSFFNTLVATNTGLAGAIFIIAYWGYYYGFAALWTAVGWAFAIFIFGWYFVPKLGEFISKGRTLHEYLGEKYNARKVRILAASLTITSYLTIIILEIYIGVEIFKIIPAKGELNIWFALGLVVFFSIYCALGGFHNVVKTDGIQLYLIIIGAFILLLFIGNGVFGTGSENTYLQAFGEKKINSSWMFLGKYWWFFLTGLLFYLTWVPASMDMWQRCAATKEVRVTRKQWWKIFIISALVLIILYGVFCLIGIFVRMNLGESINPVVDLLFSLKASTAKSTLNFIGAGILFAAFISAILSTTDTYMVVLSQAFVNDIILGSKGRSVEDLSKEENLRFLQYSRIVILFIPILGVLIGYLILSYLKEKLPDLPIIESIFYLGFVVQISLFYCIFIAVRGKRRLNSDAAFWSILFGALGAAIIVILSIILFNRYPDSYYWLLYGSPAGGLIISICFYELFAKLKKRSVING